MYTTKVGVTFRVFCIEVFLVLPQVGSKGPLGVPCHKIRELSNLPRVINWPSRSKEIYLYRSIKQAYFITNNINIGGSRGGARPARAPPFAWRPSFYWQI